MKTEYCVWVEVNEGEYATWVTFYANKVEITDNCTLLVDGYEMKFDGWIYKLEQYPVNV